MDKMTVILYHLRDANPAFEKIHPDISREYYGNIMVSISRQYVSVDRARRKLTVD